MASPLDYSTWLLSPAADLGASQKDSTATKAAHTQFYSSFAQKAFQQPQQAPSNAASTSNINMEDLRQYGLDPSSFGQVSFQVPSFLAPGGALTTRPTPSGSSSYLPESFGLPEIAQSAKQPEAALQAPPQLSLKRKAVDYVPDPHRPIYSPYGSSIVSVNPDLTPFAKIAHLTELRNLSGNNQGIKPEEQEIFDPTALGLPRVIGGNFPGLYSSSGFDLVGVLARVAARPSPQINIGPIDTSASFLVVDARKYDFPIVYASDSFTKLTGYVNSEVIGRNCRFLQAPNGQVAPGDARKHTDANGVYHMKTHILAGKETQTSLINYKKDGSAFINLITIIPITWDTDEIAYFIGFQVDLVEQPNEILQKMQAGTYTVNHTLRSNTLAVSPFTHDPSNPPNLAIDVASAEEPRQPAQTMSPTSATAVIPTMTMMNIDEQPSEDLQTVLSKALVDSAEDYIQILSLKGTFLYVSPSTERFLEYSATELLGKNLTSLCHASDVVPVMRELKELGNTPNAPINLLYRIKRKNSGWAWVDFCGKMHLDQSKNRKSVILVGRERPAYRLPWDTLSSAGGISDNEFWGKLSPQGLYLYSSSTVDKVLGFSSPEMRGTNLFQLSRPEDIEALAAAIQQAVEGSPSGLEHYVKNKFGQSTRVYSNFYPCGVTKKHRKSSKSLPYVLCQTSEYAAEVKRRRRSKLPRLPQPAGAQTREPFNSSASPMSVDSPEPSIGMSLGGADDSRAIGMVSSTFKTLGTHPSFSNENIFEELEATRNTSWQFEIHQLKLTNRKLKEELEAVEKLKRKRKRSQATAFPARNNCSRCGQVFLATQMSQTCCQLCSATALQQGSPASTSDEYTDGL